MAFDRFIIAYMGYDLHDAEAEEEIRRRAYHSFLKRVGGEKPASLPTIRKWFGIGGQKQPSRCQVLNTALALRLDVNEAGYFLTKGIEEPSFQINDYTEMMAMYCLEKKAGISGYQALVERYEEQFRSDCEICHESNTNWLFLQFEFLRKLPEDEFLYWMWEHAGVFKGYSRTTQKYLEIYREKVLYYAKKNAGRSLELLLSETDYPQWIDKQYRRSGYNEYKWIRRYLSQDKKRKQCRLSSHLANNILELARLVYLDGGENAKLISELFSKSGEGQREDSVKLVSAKHLSDLFHIPARNEQILRARQMLCETGDGETREQLQETIREAKRRRLIPGRRDLLPMILYVSQQKYLEQIREQKAAYDREKAVRNFRELADPTLIACSMVPLDEKYAFDAALLSCFQENEMYEYADVMIDLQKGEMEG